MFFGHKTDYRFTNVTPYIVRPPDTNPANTFRARTSRKCRYRKISLSP